MMTTTTNSPKTTNQTHVWRLLTVAPKLPLNTSGVLLAPVYHARIELMIAATPKAIRPAEGVVAPKMIASTPTTMIIPNPTQLGIQPSSLVRIGLVLEFMVNLLMT